MIGTSAGNSHFRVDLATAAVWDARPDWEYLRTRRELIAANVRWIEELLAADAARRSNGGLRSESPLKGAGMDDLAAVERAGQTVTAAYRSGDHDALAAAIAALCGLGPGLTPAGDDWLAGWVLGLWTSPPAARPENRLEVTGTFGSAGHFQTGGGAGGGRSVGEIVLAAAERTTTLSRAFLACAVAGEADESWHTLLNVLASESAKRRISESTNQRISELANQRISGSVNAILTHGATSGAAMLLGFVAGIDVW